MKKLRFILLFAVMLATGRVAAYDFASGGLFYNILDANAKTVELTCRNYTNWDTQSDYTGAIVVPATVSSGGIIYNVTKIGQLAFKKSEITSLTISEGIEIIDQDICEGCDQLTSLSLPSTLKSIGYAAFWSCDGLTSLILPEGLTTIGNDVFRYCGSLQKVVLPSTLTSIGERAFSNMSSLLSVVSHISTPFEINVNVFSNSNTPSSATLYVPVGSASKYQAIEGWTMFSGILEGEPMEKVIDGLNYILVEGSLMAKVIAGNYSDMESVTIPGSITVDGVNYNVKEIAERAFYRLYNIKTLKIESGVESIGGRAFCDCNNLTDLALPSTLKTIGNNAFAYCEQITSLVLPEGLTSIGEDAFYSCDNLQKLELPSSLKSIGGSAFIGCGSLTSVLSRIQTPFEIEKSVFASGGRWNDEEQKIVYVPSFATLYVPNGKKSAYEAFDGWMMFKEIVEGEPMEKVVDGLNYLYVKGGSTAKVIAGDYSDMESVTIPGSITVDGINYNVKEIAKRAFYDLDNIKTVKIESGVESIGSSAFYHCNNLKDLAFPPTLKTIGDHAFTYCRQMTSLVLPEGLTSIGEYAFYYCDYLQKLELPSSLKSIGGSAFRYCGSLTSVISRIQTPFEIEESVFASDSRWNDEEQKSVFTPSSATLYVPNGKKSAYEAFDGWMMFKETVEGELEEKVVDGLNYSYVKGGSTAKVIAGDYSAMESVTIPGSITIDGVKYYVKEIAGWAFYDLDNIKTVKIESGVESIGSGAFYDCDNLKDLALPSTLKTIGNDVFAYCYQMTSLVLPEGLTSIGEDAFYYCSNLQKLELPSSLKSIGGYAFIGCRSLTSVISRIQTPFEIEESVFASGGRWNDEEQKNIFTPSSATLYVPIGKKSAYEAFDGWMMFEEIVEGELEEKVVDGLNYSYVKGGSTAKVIAGDYSAMESVTIPGSITIDGVKYYVKEIAGWAFYGSDNLKTVKIESGVESIGSRAFYHCEGLTDLAFPSTLKMIRDYAFMYCRRITSLVLPEGLTSIGECAFMECYNLQKLELPSSLKNIGGSAFIYCGSLTSVISRIQTPFEIEKSVFASDSRWNDEEQKSVFTPSSATLYVPVGKKSAYEAFDGWMMFEEIFEGEPKEGLGVDGFNYSYIPESKVATLIKGDYSALQNVSIPATAVIGGTTYNVVGVGTSAFESTSVKSVTVSNGVKTIGKNAFYDCYQMTSVSMPESITKIGERAFYECYQLDTIAIPGRVESIGNYAFSDCKIKEVVVPSSTKTIGYCAFRNCRQIISIRVDAANTVYDSRNNCNALIETASNTLMLGCPSTIIPNSINEIYNYAFYGFSNLTQISIPNSVTTIRNGAFESCSGLTSIYIPSSVTTIENNIFYGCNSLNSIKVDPNNTVYDSRNDCNALIKTSTNTLVSGCNKTIIPRGIKTIGSNSFSGISGLDSLKIPYGVEKIQNYAFSYNSVRYVEIPNSIKTIGWYAFGGNYELTTIVCKIKNPSDVNVDEGAFYDSSIQSSAVLYVPKGMKSVYEQATNIWRNFSNIEEMTGEPLAAPTLSYDGRAVTATSTEKDVDLYYSTDGTVPSNYYEGPIAVSNLGTVKVIAEKSFCADSEPSTYDVKYLYDGDTLKLAEAGLMAEAIKWCGNDNVVKMTVVGPINSAEFETIRTLKNLKFLNLAEAKVDGLTIPDNAFANSNIVSFVAPATIRSVGSGIFTGCQQLAAINWDTNVSLPGDALADVSNPNLLLYLKEGASVPAGVKNVIIGGAATKITLVDATGNNNFYCPVAFTTDSITYTRNFQQKTEVGVSRGWETIVLPFDVKTIVHEKNGNLVSFANYRSWNNEKPFWLYTLEENNISAASEIKANVPYLICMPNDDVYGDDYILAGNVTFSAFDKSKKIRIDVSKPVEKSQYDIAFVPAYQRVPASADVFALNVNQEYMGYPAGSLFVNNFREVRPFEAYSLHPNTSKAAAARMIMVSSLIGDGDDTTGIIDVMMKKKDAKNGGDAIIKVYTLSGALIKQGRADEVTKSLPKGIYIANGKKFVIK